MTQTKAYLWFLWRNSLNGLLIRIVMTVPFLMIMTMFMPQLFAAGGGELDRQEQLGSFLCILFISNLTQPFSSDNVQHSGFAFRSGFIRPVTTIWLVAVPVAFAVVASVVVYLLQAGIVRVVLGDALPLFLPSVLIACVTVWMLAVIWIPTTQRLRVLAVGVLWCSASGASIVYQFKLLTLMSHSLSWPVAVSLAASTMAAIAAMLIGVERQRHGDQWTFRPQAKRQSAKPINTTLLPAWPRSKHRSLLAQFWLEWQLCRTPVLAASLIFPVMMFLLQTLGPVLVDDDWHAELRFLWLVTLAICPLVYQFIATASIGFRFAQIACGLRRFEFEATRALTNGQMIAVKMLVVLVGMTIGSFGMAVAAGLHSLTGLTNTWTQASELVTAWAEHVPALWWLAAAIALPLSYLSSIPITLSFWLMRTRHPNWFAILWGSGICIAVVLLFTALIASSTPIARQGGQLQLLKAWWPACCYMEAVVVVIGCVQSLRRAIKSKAMRPTSLFMTVYLWLVFVICVVFLFLYATPLTPMSLPEIVLGTACLLIPLASTVAGPYLLASHRHT